MPYALCSIALGGPMLYAPCSLFASPTQLLLTHKAVERVSKSFTTIDRDTETTVSTTVMASAARSMSSRVCKGEEQEVRGKKIRQREQCAASLQTRSTGEHRAASAPAVRAAAGGEGRWRAH